MGKRLKPLFLPMAYDGFGNHTPMSHNEAARVAFTDDRLRTEIKAQIAWMESCAESGDKLSPDNPHAYRNNGQWRLGYLRKYGITRGRFIYDADLARLEELLAEFRRRGCPSAPRGGDNLKPL